MKKIKHILSWLLVITMLGGLLPARGHSFRAGQPEAQERTDSITAPRLGTTPPPGGEGAQVLSEDEVITPEDVADSLERYQNFLAADLSLFYWSEEGINVQNDGRLSTPEELEYVKRRGLEITAGCETADEKIYALAEYLAKNICYDYDAFEGRKPEEEHTRSNAYDVLTREYCTCGGYAVTFAVMLQQLGIPSVVVISPDHAYNMVYNGSRWMLIDVTWMSASTMRYGVKNKVDSVNLTWYDFTIEQANAEYHHVIKYLPYSICNGTLESFPKESAVTEFVVPGNVTAIGERAFYNCQNLKNVVLDDGVESIGYCAFADCLNINSFTMSNTVTTIDDGAFWGCTSLIRFTIPDSVTSFGDYVLYNCTGLKHLSIGDGITSLDNWYLSNHPNLVSVKLGSGITSIGDWTFHNCAKLTTVTLSRGIETIGAYAFMDCKALTNIAIPGSVKTIGERAFMECSNLAGVTLYNGLESIGYGAFADCVSLAKIIIPGSVTSIGDWAFCYCTKLATVTLVEGIKTIGECAFYESNAIQTVNYTGSRDQWRAISIAGWNDTILNARINYNVQPPVLDEPEVPNIPDIWDEDSNMGDVNGDGTVNLGDVQLLFMYTRGKAELSDTGLSASDVNDDGEINLGDVQLLFMFTRSRAAFG